MSAFLPGISDPIPAPEVWPPTIEHRRGPASVARHLAALRALVAVTMSTPARAGDGIVTVGGGKYWPGIVVGVRLLREAGCNLPVEVWHRGALEPVSARDVAGLNVDIVDATATARRLNDNRVEYQNEWRGGWESKLYALTHTGFQHVLFLDADAYCVADPAPLFGLLTNSEPFAFWSDLPHMDGCVKWPAVWPGGAAGVPAVQGGQLLIDTRAAWRTLAVAHWLCQHSDFYFCHVYGDQDCWRVALAAGASPYRCIGPADWVQPAFVCAHGGADYVVHRCQSKLFPGAEPRRCDAIPRESRVFDLLAGRPA